MRFRVPWFAVLIFLTLNASVLLHAESPVAPAAESVWSGDIDYLAAELPRRHPDPFRHVSAAEFNADLMAVKARAASISSAEVAIELQEAVAKLRDAHTEVDTRVAPMSFFPLRLCAFDDGIFVTRTNDESRGACGARLTAIDGMPVSEVFERVSRVVSAENDAWLRARVPASMVRAEVLASLGVTGGGSTARFTFESSPGVPFDLNLGTIAPAAAGEILGKPYAGTDLPLYLQHAELNYWYSWDPEQRLLYLKYNVCADDPSRTFESVARELYAIVKQENVGAFVIDLRNNTGGSDAVLRPLIDAIPATPELKGRVFAIIGRETFSSAMLNAVQLRAAGAVLVGESTGGKPNSFGEVATMKLPSTGLPVYYSTRFIQAMDQEVSTLEPDVRVTFTSADFFARRDPVLASVLARMAAPSLAPQRRRAVPPAPPRQCL